MKPDAAFVSVFKTDDPGVLPLATMALEAEGIPYLLINEGKVDSMEWVMSQQPTNRPVVQQILVSSEVAAKARDLLVDLERPLSTPLTAAPPMMPDTFEPPPLQLVNALTGLPIGRIAESQLQDLTSRLEEDAPQQYFLNVATIDMLQQAGADSDLVALLRQSIGADGALVIRWVVR